MTIEFSKRLEIGRKCEGKKPRWHWICKFEMREEGRAVRNDRESRPGGRWVQVFEASV